MKPTAIGLSSTRTFTIKNTSRIPLKFNVTLPPASLGVLSVSPTFGVLRGNQNVSLTIMFTPKKSYKYTYKMKVMSYPISGVPQRVLDARQPGKTTQSKPLQTLSVNIVAAGDAAAIVFDPPRSTMNVRLVSTQEQTPLYLENVTDADILYFLQYKTEFTLETGELNPSSEVSDIMDLTRPKIGPDKKFTHSLFCNEPTGVLPARSRTKLIMTFFPLRAGLYEFMVYARVKAANKKGQIAMISNDEAALLRITNVNIENGQIPQSPSAFTRAMRQDMQDNPLSAGIDSPTIEGNSQDLDFGFDQVSLQYEQLSTT